MTIEPRALGGDPIRADLDHCPMCGSELRTGTDDHVYECPACEYTEREMSA
ncbi:hypothetical protein [Aeromonas sp. MdU4]|uniref:hypothetical protein n=1 Tax=Aeromonas sp. MdU4 TaxID=3342819 RepID=UPI0035BA3231